MATTLTTRTIYFAGSPLVPGTSLSNNVTGECDHQHRTPEGAQRCIERMDRAIKSGYGPNAYCDRVVMTAEIVYDQSRRRWLHLAGTTKPYNESVEEA